MSAEQDLRDAEHLQSLGYAQELWRRMGGFANFAVSFSIISILSGGITSFDQGLAAAGPGEMGYGWPIVCVFSLLMAMAMAEIASSFPTAGGLYHWAAILGGRAWGWVTAWLNLIGLVTVLAAIDFGAVEFFLGWAGPTLGLDLAKMGPDTAQAVKVGLTLACLVTQGLVNHMGIGLTAILTDLSAWVHIVGALALTGSLWFFARHHPVGYLFEVQNLTATSGVFPPTASTPWAFVLGFLMAAYTVTGYDASAHTAEETMDAEHLVPWGMVMAVAVSGVFGWLMIGAITLAIPDLPATLRSGHAVVYVMEQGLPRWLNLMLLAIISAAQYFCGLATVTSASRMIYAFARDGGLPGWQLWKQVSPRFRTPAPAIWLSVGLAVVFTVCVKNYSTITCAATVALYVSYAIPIALGIFARGGRWATPGVWSLGAFGRPVASIAVVWAVFVTVILVQPPNDLAGRVLAGCGAGLAAYWFGFARRHFRGPPAALLTGPR